MEAALEKRMAPAATSRNAAAGQMALLETMWSQRNAAEGRSSRGDSNDNTGGVNGRSEGTREGSGNIGGTDAAVISP